MNGHPTPEHGTYNRYKLGCPCTSCHYAWRKKQAAYQRAYRLRLKTRSDAALSIRELRVLGMIAQHQPITAQEIADELGCTRRAVHAMLQWVRLKLGRDVVIGHRGIAGYRLGSRAHAMLEELRCEAHNEGPGG